jgi:Chaperone of endosialidase
MKNLSITTLISRSPLRCGLFLLSIALCWFALSPGLQAQCINPPGDCGGQNTGVGPGALANFLPGAGGAVLNTGVGFQALFSDTTGDSNTAVGERALFTNDVGSFGTAIGGEALFNNLDGQQNVGVGFRTLFTNTHGSQNTGMGFRTLAFNESGNDNTAIGWNGLFNNRGTASGNTAIGSQALLDNVVGNNNTATGFQALLNNNSDEQTAVGAGALAANVTALQNVAVGFNASNALVGGGGGTNGFSVAVGYKALELATNGQNTAVGDFALGGLTTGTLNTAIGDLAGDHYTGAEFGNVDIGAFTEGVAGESNVIHIADPTGSFLPAGSCFIGGIGGVTTAGMTDFVIIDPITGQLGSIPSSAQFKKDIEPMGKASEVIYSLKPVTFHYKNDSTNHPESGLIAEEVAKVNPDLIGVDKEGKPHSVRYNLVWNMLLNEFLKEHKKVEAQQASIAELKSTVAQQAKGMEVLTAQLREQAAQIQKVSAQVEMGSAKPRTLATNP